MESAEARLATAQAKLRDLIIVSPFDGVLGIRHVSRGTLLNPGTLITTLDDLSAVKLDFAVPETFLASLKPGQDIEAHSVAWPGETFKGTVSCIDSRVDANTRAVTVQAVIPNPENRLRPGMLLTVKLFSNQRNSACVPEKALVAYGEHQYVYILRKDSTVEKREVKLGQRDSGQVEITAGLNKNECIVVEGTTDLRDGAKVLMSDGGKTDVGGNNRPRTSSPEK